MAICYNCNQKKSGFTQFPSNFFGKKICFDCCESLGISTCLTTEEHLYPHKHFSSYEEAVSVLRERKALYGQMVNNFTATLGFKYGDSNNYNGADIYGTMIRTTGMIEIDEPNQLVRISVYQKQASFFNDSIKTKSTYIRYHDITDFSIQNVNSRYNDSVLDMKLCRLDYKLYGKINSYSTFATANAVLINFFTDLISKK